MKVRNLSKLGLLGLIAISQLGMINQAQAGIFGFGKGKNRIVPVSAAQLNKGRESNAWTNSGNSQNGAIFISVAEAAALAQQEAMISNRSEGPFSRGSSPTQLTRSESSESNSSSNGYQRDPHSQTQLPGQTQ